MNDTLYHILVWVAKDHTYHRGISDCINAPHERTRSGRFLHAVTVMLPDGSVEYINAARICLDTPENEAKLKVMLALGRQVERTRKTFLRELRSLRSDFSANISVDTMKFTKVIGSMSGRIDLDKSPFTEVERGHAEDRIHRMSPPPGFGLTEAEVADAVRQALLAKKPIVDGSSYHE